MKNRDTVMAMLLGAVAVYIIGDWTIPLMVPLYLVAMWADLRRVDSAAKRNG